MSVLSKNWRTIKVDVEFYVLGDCCQAEKEGGGGGNGGGQSDTTSIGRCVDQGNGK